MEEIIFYLLILSKSKNPEAKDFVIHKAPLCLFNISKKFSVDNLNNTGLYGYIYGFSINYDSIDGADILDIHKHLMKKHNIR